MSQTLPRLRNNLDFMESPVAERPGLLIRDPYQYSDATLIIPPVLVRALSLFDGESTDLDLRQALVDLTGELQVGELAEHLTDALSTAGFLENDAYAKMRDDRHSEFAQAEIREPSHAGGAYPDTEDELRETFDGYLQSSKVEPMSNLVGIAAPHVSPSGGAESYADAYRALGPEHCEKVFVVLGTSHYGQPDRFGLTRKKFLTPYGETRTEKSWVDRLESQAPGAVLMEDYCHATEHSIEFQVAFLQHVYGADVRILPILVGSFWNSISKGGVPEDNDDLRRFFGALGELHAKHKKELVWVLGVDMAHIGRRYGDPIAARAYETEMIRVSGRDKDRIGRIAAGDSRGYWERIQENEDDLKWCGSAPIYTFLKSVPEARGEMLRYQHWQIDPQSVVSFAAMAFQG